MANQLAIVILKPGFGPLKDLVSGDLEKAKFKISGTGTIQPGPEFAEAFYGELMKTSEDAKRNISRYMGDARQQNMVLLVIEGEDAFSKLSDVKKQIRAKYALNPPNATKNVIHTPTSIEEGRQNIEALLKLQTIGKADLSPAIREKFSRSLISGVSAKR